MIKKCIITWILISLALTGCSDKKVESGSDKNVLSMAIGAELTTLYPLNMDSQNLVVTRLCYEQLIEYVDGEIKPWLAESWEFGNEGKSLTFHLKKGVKFHDGAVFNAEAVKAGFGFASRNPNFRSITPVHKLKSIDVVDEYTVRFNYDEPYFAYLSEFSYREVMVCVSPNVIEEGNFQTMKGVVGTGPYIYSEYRMGEYVKFAKNPEYWGDEPEYDEIIVKYIPENSSRLMALKNGEVDLVYGNGMISWDDYKQALNYRNVEGMVSPYASRTSSVVVNAANPLLDDIRVREAIAYAIDKRAISTGLTHGNEPAADYLYPEEIWLTNTQVEPLRTYDPEKSASLLSEAGWVMNEDTGIREKDGVPLKLKFTYDSGETMNKMVVTAIKSQLAEIGVDAFTVGQDMMTWWKEGVSGNYGLILWGSEQTTAPQKYFKNIPTSSPHTPSLKAIEGSQIFMDSIEEMQTTGDLDRVKEIFDYLLTYNNEQVVDIPLRYLKEPILYNSQKIKGYEFTSTPMMFEIDNLKTVEE